VLHETFQSQFRMMATGWWLINGTLLHTGLQKNFIHLHIISYNIKTDDHLSVNTAFKFILLGNIYTLITGMNRPVITITTVPWQAVATLDWAVDMGRTTARRSPQARCLRPTCVERRRQMCRCLELSLAAASRPVDSRNTADWLISC